MAKQNLKTVKNYSLLINKSVTWVYKLIKAGQVKTNVIDGVIFIIVK
jgi:hypothetical protein